LSSIKPHKAPYCQVSRQIVQPPGITALRHGPCDRSDLVRLGTVKIEGDTWYGIKHPSLPTHITTIKIYLYRCSPPHSYDILANVTLVRLHAPRIIAGAVPRQHWPALMQKSGAQIQVDVKVGLSTSKVAQRQPCQNISWAKHSHLWKSVQYLVCRKPQPSTPHLWAATRRAPRFTLP